MALERAGITRGAPGCTAVDAEEGTVKHALYLFFVRRFCRLAALFAVGGLAVGLVHAGTSFSGTYTIHDNSIPQNTITFQVSVNAQYSVQTDGSGTTALTCAVAVTANPGGFDSVTVGGEYATGGVVFENVHGGTVTVSGIAAGQQININAFATISGVAWNTSGGNTAGVIGNVTAKTASRRFQLGTTNPNNFDITVQMYDACSDQLLGSVTIPAGGSKAWSATDESGCGIQTTLVTKGHAWNPESGAWEDTDPDTVSSINDAFLAPSSGTPVAAGGSQALNRGESSTTSLPTQTNLTGTSGLAGVVEGQVPFTNTQLADTAALSNGVFRSGANAVVDSVNRASDKIAAAVSTGGAGGGGGGGGGGTVTVDLSPVTTAIGQTNSKVDAVKTSVDAVKQELVDEKSAADSRRSDAESAASAADDAAAAAGSAAGSAASSVVNSQGGSAPVSLGYTVPTGADYSDALRVEMPASFGGVTFDFNPFKSGRFLVISHWFRDAVAWAVLVGLGVWIWAAMGDWVRGFSTIRQAHGNAVVGGTGAQATALVAAGLMTTAVVVSMTALVAWTFGDIGFSALRSVTQTNPVASMPTMALGMLSELMPVSTIISAFVARISFNFYGAALFAGCSAVIRFVVP